MSSSVSCEGKREIPRPTLLIHTSYLPKCSITRAETASSCFLSVTSATSGREPSHSAETARSCFSRRATRATRAPAAAACRATCSPIPAEAPVTTMTSWSSWTAEEAISRPARRPGGVDPACTPVVLL
eukprot:scaffold242703_cov33-Tisochrysis_lutea.AAC.2